MLPRCRPLAVLVTALTTTFWTVVALAGPAAAAPAGAMDRMDRKGGPLAAVLGVAALLIVLGLGVGAWRIARGGRVRVR